MEQKEETKFFDFTQVEMEVSFDEKMKVDISQTLGNVIHQNTGDLGLDEIARTIYKEGKADIMKFGAWTMTHSLVGKDVTGDASFKEYITNLDLNKYVKEGFIRSLEKEPKTLKETEKLLKEYLGE